MKLRIKLLLLLLIAFMTFASLVIGGMIYLSQRNARESSTALTQEYVLSNQQLIQQSALMLFDTIAYQEQEQDLTFTQNIINGEVTEFPMLDHLYIFNRNGELLFAMNQQSEVLLLADQHTLKREYDRTLLQDIQDFQLNNNEAFISDPTLTTKPVLLYLRALHDQQIILGYGQTLPVTQTRLWYLQQINQEMTRNTLLTIGVWAVFLLCVTLLITHLLIRRQIVQPIGELVEACQQPDPQAEAFLKHMKGKDELGVLAEAFYKMTLSMQQALRNAEESNEALERRVAERTQALRQINEELEQQIQVTRQALQERDEMQQQLIDSARQAGMAEVTTNILHNVGNALNSVNAITDSLRRSAHATLEEDLMLLAALIEKQGKQLHTFIEHDPQGQQFPEFFKALALQFHNRNNKAKDELRQLIEHIEHIRNIIRVQQTQALPVGIFEKIFIKEIVDDALNIIRPHSQHLEIHLDCNDSPHPEILTDRHRLIQILVNLMNNAIEAITRQNPASPKIEITIQERKASQVMITITDNGIGIPAQIMPRLFEHGFTTRHDGHGFGLHSSSLNAISLGGSIEAFSEGEGHGAQFVLALPLEGPQTG